jgi:hypothetical protein
LILDFSDLATGLLSGGAAVTIVDLEDVVVGSVAPDDGEAAVGFVRLD